MRANKLIVGEYYRHKGQPKGCYAKVLKVLGPKEGVNLHNRIIVECAWSQDKHPNSLQLIKYFKPSDLIEDKT